MTTYLQINEQELAHILLGLRFLQTDGCFAPAEAQDFIDELIDNEGHNLMQNADIDSLCERITPEGSHPARVHRLL